MSYVLCSSSVDWGDVATWVAGLATLGAVWVALHAAKKERQRAIELQERDWRRVDERLKVRTARLANAFHRDLVYAARELTMVIANLNPKNFEDLTIEMAEYLINGRPKMQLPMVDRFAGELDGFENKDALALLTAIASWRHLSGPLSISLAELTPQRAKILAANIRATALAMHGEHAALNDRMITYFADMPELSGVVEDEIPAELREAMRG